METLLLCLLHGFAIQLIGNGRGACHAKLPRRIALSRSFGRAQHRGQIVENFLPPRTRKQCHRAPVGLWLSVLGAKGSHLIDRGIAHVGYGVMVLLFKEIYFKRQNREQAVYVAPDVFDAPLFPRPYLRGNIIEHGANGAVVHETRHLQVEAGIVHEYQRVGLPLGYLPLAVGHALQNGAQVQQHGNEPHVGKILVVAQQRAAHGCHAVAAVKGKFGFGVGRF